MNKKLAIILTGCLIAAVMMSGCSSAGDVQVAANSSQSSSTPKVSQTAVSQQEDTEIKKLISDYFVKLYSGYALNYQKNLATGSIPEDLKSFLAKRAVEEGNNNAEVGLNFPRFVGMNGITMVSYKMLTDDKEPQVDSTFIENVDGTVLYFVKVNLLASCVPDSTFDAHFTLDPNTNTYQKTSDIAADQVDSIKVQAKYDVELVKEKEDSAYKIIRARESAYKHGAKNRLFRYNNDFITRLPYLNLEQSDDKTGAANKEDSETYKGECTVITSFLDNILSMDGERRTLLGGSWDDSYSKFSLLAETIGIDKDKDKNEILLINDRYKELFPKEALLLQSDIMSIKKKGDYTITMHPAYSKLNRWYIVSFNGTMKKSIGSAYAQEYSFDFFIKLTAGKTTKVSNVKLNKMAPVVKTESKEAAGSTGSTETAAASDSTTAADSAGSSQTDNTAENTVDVQ